MEGMLRNALIDLTGRLDRLRIPYAITGSVAGAVHGEPVTSQDVDVLVQATSAQAAALADAMPDHFYRDREMLRTEAGRFGMANLVDTRTGFKIDLSFVPASGYLHEAVNRAAGIRLGSTGPEFRFTSAEDVVLMKLLWRKDSQSRKQWENALGVVRVRGARLDWSYLFLQAARLGVTDDLIDLRNAGGV